jgi:short-subunit dehydrogenase
MLNIVITGAAMGLGEYLAGRLSAEENFQVIGIDRVRKDDLKPSVREFFSKYYEFDLTYTAKIPGLIDDIYRDFNEIDVFINNAGLKTFGKLSELTDETIQNTIIVNYITPAIIIKSLLNKMLKSGKGIIINISSNAAFQGYSEGSIYCSSKSALNTFTEAINDEISQNPNIKIYTLCPSTILTKELLEKHPQVNPDKYISTGKVYKIIERLIKNGSNKKIIPIIPFRQTLKYIIQDIKKIFKGI